MKCETILLGVIQLEEVDYRVVEILSAISNEVRYQICQELAKQRDQTSSDLAETIGRKQTNISQHLRSLRDLNLVSSKRKAKQVYYRLKRPDIVLHILELREKLKR